MNFIREYVLRGRGVWSLVLRIISVGYGGVLKAMMSFAMAILPLTALVVTFEVVMRYGFNSPTVWAVDLAAFSLLWATFLAAPWLVRTNGHTRITFVVDKLSNGARSTLRGVLYVMAGIVCAILAYKGVGSVGQALSAGTLTGGSWEIPRAYVWIVIPVGSAALVIEFFRGAVASFGEARRGGADVLGQEDLIAKGTAL